MLEIYHEDFLRVAIRHKSSVYLYGELYHHAYLFEKYFVSHNVKRVAIIVSKEPILYAIIWGAYLSGITFSIINYYYPIERKKRCLKAFSPDVVVSREFIEKYVIVSPEDILSSYCECKGDFFVEDIALVLFTSGSTGEPKGVKIRRSALEHIIWWCQNNGELRSDDIYGQYSDVSFDMGICDVFYGLSVGATLVLIDGLEKTIPGSIIKQYGITYWYSVPTVLDFMIKRDDISSSNLHTLRVMGFGGAILYRKHLELLFAAVSSLHVFNTYGPTEVTIFSSYVTMNKETYRRYATDTICIGSPIDGMKYKLIDIDGTNKEIIAVSNNNFAGYLYSEIDLDKKVPIFSFATRDIVREEEGELYFVARIDNMVKINGNRVDLDEIDILIRNKYNFPAVSIAKNDFIFTFVESKENVDVGAVRKFLVGRLPLYSVPRNIIQVDKLPQTANQKYDKMSLYDFIEE